MESAKKTINIRQAIIDNLEKTIEKYDYMTLVSVHMKIKSGYYESDNIDQKVIEKDIKFLTSYKKSYSHISKQIDEILEYLNNIYLVKKIENPS